VYCLLELTISLSLSLYACVSLLWANAESIQIRNASDGELVREITTPGYNFVRVGNSVWSSIWSGTAGQIRIYNIGVRSGVRTFLASCKFANSAPCAQQTMKVKTEFSIATRISSLVAVGEQVWGACQDRKIRIWSAKVHWH